MDFFKVFEKVTQKLDEQNVHYALIGGFAMALRGVQRTTVDLDFILMLEDLDTADAIFQDNGYQRAFRSENVSHYQSDQSDLGRIDILHAFRGPTLSMLKRADRIETGNGYSLPVVRIEDIIGLKVQASVNNPRRTTGDWNDIRMMLEYSGETNQTIDWELLEDYLSLFQLQQRLPEMKDWYGKTH